MEFKISQAEIETCLRRSQGFINIKGANPILSHIKIKTTKEGIEAFATDYDLGLKGSYVASVADQGTVTLHGRMLYDIVRQLPDEEIIFHYTGSGRCDISCGKSSFKLAAIDPDEFPEEPDYPADQLINLDTEMFKDMLKKTSYAISQNESRMTLNGILMQMYPNALKVVATDGHRLSYVNRNVDLPLKKPLSVIISRKAVMEVSKLLDEAEGPLQVVRFENRVFFKMGTMLFFSREIDGSYPNYDQVIPRKNTKIVVMDVENAKLAIKLVATVADEKSRMINFHFKKDKLEISCDVSEVGEAHEEIDIEYSGEPFKVGLNSNYALDALNHIQSEKVIFKMEAPLDAVLIQPTDDDDYVSIIMPMRI